MKKINFLDLISKLGAAAYSSGGREGQKKGAEKTSAKQNSVEGLKGVAPIGGDFKKSGEQYISPKQSVVEMIRRHEALSKRIDESLAKIPDEKE